MIYFVGVCVGVFYCTTEYTEFHEVLKFHFSSADNADDTDKIHIPNEKSALSA